MSQVFKIGERLFAFEQQWYFLTGEDGEKKEIARYAEKEGGAKHLTIVRRKGVSCGYFTATPPRDKTPVFSAAAIFAEACPADNALLVYEIDEAHYSIIAVRDGMPDSGKDRIAPADEAKSLAQRFIQDSGGTSISVYGNAGFFTDELPFDFETIEFDEKNSELQITPLRKSVAGIMVVVFLLALGMFGYFGFLEEYLAEQKRIEAQNNTVDPVQAYIENAQQEFVSEYARPAKLTGAAYMTILDNFGLYKSGWTAAKIDCVKNQCTAEWIREFWGTNRDFVNETSSSDSLKLDVKGEKITESLPVVFTSLSPPSIKQLPVIFHFLKETVSLFQEYSMAGITYELHDPAVFGVKPGTTKPGVVPGGFILRGKWTLTGDMGFAKEAINGLPDNMHLGLLRVMLDGQNLLNSTFRAEGFYYVRGQ